MAKNDKVSLPAGFKPLQSRLDGWFVVEEGNEVTGKMVDSFIVKGEFGPKRVYKVEVTDGDTAVIDADGEKITVGAGAVVGVDEKGFLKALANVEQGKRVFIRCKGQEDKPRKKGQSPAWMFDLGVAD